MTAKKTEPVTEYVEPARLPDVVTKTDVAVRVLLEAVSRDVGVSIHELASRTIVIEGGVVRVEE